jgi:hypothetical protein
MLSKAYSAHRFGYVKAYNLRMLAQVAPSIRNDKARRFLEYCNRLEKRRNEKVLFKSGQQFWSKVTNLHKD